MSSPRRKESRIWLIGQSALIELTKHCVAVIDQTDLPLVAGYCWYAKVCRGKFYAASDTKGPHIYMHKLLTGEKETDHEDGDGFNNRRSNLRACTRTQNLGNIRLPVTNTSGVKGVRWNKGKQKWHAQISKNNKTTHVGYFSTLEQGAAAYAQAAREYFGSFARPTCG